MHPSIAGPIESRNAWEDTTSWTPVTVTTTTPHGVTVSHSGVETYLAFPRTFPLRGTPSTAAYSEPRGLLALGAQTGPVIPVDRTFGVFGLLGDHPAYVFMKVSPGTPPEPDQACHQCGYPDGTPRETLCGYHAQPMDMGHMFRGSRMGRLEAAADAQAFAGPAQRLAPALRELAKMALPLEAARFAHKYGVVLDRFTEPNERALVLNGITTLVTKSAIRNQPDFLPTERQTLLDQGIRAVVDESARTSF